MPKSIFTLPFAIAVSAASCAAATAAALLALMAFTAAAIYGLNDRINPPAREVGRDKGVGRGGVRATGNPVFDSVMYVMYTVPKSVPITKDKYLSSLLFP